MRLVAAFVLQIGTVPGETAPKTERPVCSKQNAGRFYPEEANFDPALARSLARSGTLEICTCRRRSYRWISPTVNFRDLRKSR